MRTYDIWFRLGRPFLKTIGELEGRALLTLAFGKELASTLCFQKL